MRFFPLQDGIYNPVVQRDWIREFRNSNKPYKLTDKGSFGTVTTRWRPEYKKMIFEVQFDLDIGTWMLYDFREYPILGLYSTYYIVDFRLEERDYRLYPNEITILDDHNRPALFHFPKGKYILYLFPHLDMQIHKNYLYAKAVGKAVSIIKKIAHQNNSTI